MKTQREIEIAVCNSLAGFAQEFLGEESKTIRAYLLNDLLVVRLKGMLTAAEQRLLSTSEDGKGIDLLKRLRTQLIERLRLTLADLVEEITGVKVLSLHHDMSTVTGEQIIILALPECA